jgi:hypothetical protein
VDNGYRQVESLQVLNENREEEEGVPDDEISRDA